MLLKVLLLLLIVTNLLLLLIIRFVVDIHDSPLRWHSHIRWSVLIVVPLGDLHFIWWYDCWFVTFGVPTLLFSGWKFIQFYDVVDLITFRWRWFVVTFDNSICCWVICCCWFPFLYIHSRYSLRLVIRCSNRYITVWCSLRFPTPDRMNRYTFRLISLVFDTLFVVPLVISDFLLLKFVIPVVRCCPVVSIHLLENFCYSDIHCSEPRYISPLFTEAHDPRSLGDWLIPLACSQTTICWEVVTIVLHSWVMNIRDRWWFVGVVPATSFTAPPHLFWFLWDTPLCSHTTPLWVLQVFHLFLPLRFTYFPLLTFTTFCTWVWFTGVSTISDFVVPAVVICSPLVLVVGVVRFIPRPSLLLILVKLWQAGCYCWQSSDHSTDIDESQMLLLLLTLMILLTSDQSSWPVLLVMMTNDNETNLIQLLLFNIINQCIIINIILWPMMKMANVDIQYYWPLVLVMK